MGFNYQVISSTLGGRLIIQRPVRVPLIKVIKQYKSFVFIWLNSRRLKSPWVIFVWWYYANSWAIWLISACDKVTAAFPTGSHYEKKSSIHVIRSSNLHLAETKTNWAIQFMSIYYFGYALHLGLKICLIRHPIIGRLKLVLKYTFAIYKYIPYFGLSLWTYSDNFLVGAHKACNLIMPTNVPFYVTISIYRLSFITEYTTKYLKACSFLYNMFVNSKPFAYETFHRNTKTEFPLPCCLKRLTFVDIHWLICLHYQCDIEVKSVIYLASETSLHDYITC